MEILVASNDYLRSIRQSFQHKIHVSTHSLYLMDCPIPSDCDGKALIATFNEGYVNSHPISYGAESNTIANSRGEDVYSKDNEEEIRKRLAALG